MPLRGSIADATISMLLLPVWINNMKTVLIFALIVLLTIIACRKPEIARDIPNCIYLKIAANKNNHNWETGSVEEYLFQNKIVYAFGPDEKIIADGSTIIKEANCNQLCSIGGFGGPAVNLCNGENFYQTAILKRTVWKKK
jgi:hypothetical protein